MKRILCSVAMALLFALASSGQEDPPYRVARLNYISGNVSMEPAGIDQWSPADLNRPFTIGDYLYADQGSRAELHLDVAVIRIADQASFGFLNLNDQAVQIKLTEGDMYIRVHDFPANQTFEVDTPNGAVTLLRDGIYRFRVDPNGTMSFVVVREGQAEITGGGQAFTLNPGNSAELTGTDQLAYDIQVAPDADDFDQWCQARDAHEARLVSARYLPPTVIGYEDLDDYGTWQTVPNYGPVWYPQQVAVGWAPYHYGHWAWIEPWGWTWVDDMAWGFAPFHYGRWAYIGNRWGWCPGPIAVVGYRGPAIRPYYAPAMVAWFGGAHFGIGVSIGGPSLGWVALGFGEIYTPTYACSRPYFTNVNRYNTTIVNNVNITNVYNTVYVEHKVYNQTIVNVRAPNAVMAMPQSAFATGASVRQAGVVVRQVNATQLQTAAVMAPPVAPTRQAVLPNARPASHPPAQVLQRQVVARTTPPPAPAAFATRQQYLQQHAGQPHDFAAMHQAVAPSAPPPQVRKVAAVQPVPVHPGERVGNIAPVARVTAPQPSRPAQQYSQPERPVQPQPPPQPTAHGVPPNLRQNQPSQQVTENPNSTKRTSAPQQQPNFEERTQPTPQNQQPSRSQQPAYAERPAKPNETRPTQEPPNHEAPPNQPQRSAERTSPQERTPPANVNERSQSQPHTYAKPNVGYPVRTPEPKTEERPQAAPKTAPEHKEQHSPPKDSDHKDHGR